MTPFRENLRGIVAMVLGNALFLVNDAQVKLVSETMPIGQLIFLRGLISTVFIGAIVFWTGQYRAFGQLRHWAIPLRCIGEIGAAFLYLYALFRMPIANINAILQIVPLMITAAGAIFLKEQVGWRRWTAIVAGFIGVLVVVRPGLAGFDAISLIACAAMVFVTLKDFTTRLLPRFLPAMLIGGVTAAVVGASGAVYGAGEDWIMPGWREIALLVSASAFIIGGYYTSVLAMRHGDISVVAPFRYAVVIWAIILGFLVWGEVPDLPMLVGTAIIILAGIYTFNRERRLAREAAEAVNTR
jgi:drug/metabolite transporter (DMT)-like permease